MDTSGGKLVEKRRRAKRTMQENSFSFVNIRRRKKRQQQIDGEKTKTNKMNVIYYACVSICLYSSIVCVYGNKWEENEAIVFTVEHIIYCKIGTFVLLRFADAVLVIVVVFGVDVVALSISSTILIVRLQPNVDDIIFNSSTTCELLYV